MTTRTLEHYQAIYGKIDAFYDSLCAEEKSWMDDNWKSLVERFVESLAEGLEEALTSDFYDLWDDTDPQVVKKATEIRDSDLPTKEKRKQLSALQASKSSSRKADE